jgi:hypothetical protein
MLSVIVIEDGFNAVGCEVPSPPPTRGRVQGGTYFNMAALLYSDDRLSIKIGPKKNSHQFLFDIRNFVSGCVRVAGHVCTLPAENRRFGDSPNVPSEGKLITVTGSIRCAAERGAFGDQSVKRLHLEVIDINYLGVDSLPSSPNIPRGTLFYCARW